MEAHEMSFPMRCMCLGLTQASFNVPKIYFWTWITHSKLFRKNISFYSNPTPHTPSKSWWHTKGIIRL